MKSPFFSGLLKGMCIGFVCCIAISAIAGKVTVALVYCLAAWVSGKLSREQ